MRKFIAITYCGLVIFCIVSFAVGIARGYKEQMIYYWLVAPFQVSNETGFYAYCFLMMLLLLRGITVPLVLLGGAVWLMMWAFDDGAWCGS